MRISSWVSYFQDCRTGEDPKSAGSLGLGSLVCCLQTFFSSTFFTRELILLRAGDLPIGGSLSHSVVSDSEIPWAVDRKSPLLMKFSRQEYCCGWPFPSPGDSPDPALNPGFLLCSQIFYLLSHQGSHSGQAIFLSQIQVPCVTSLGVVHLPFPWLLPHHQPCSCTDAVSTLLWLHSSKTLKEFREILRASPQLPMNQDLCSISIAAGGVLPHYGPTKLLIFLCVSWGYSVSYL